MAMAFSFRLTQVFFVIRSVAKDLMAIASALPVDLP